MYCYLINKKMKALPPKTVERLSLYRRVLKESFKDGELHIYSHQIAALLHITPEQVRRDLMLIEYSSTLKKGYEIDKLIDQINRILDPEEPINFCIVGMGNLGKALTNYYNQKNKKLKIIAAFDNDPEKTDRVVSRVHCHHINDLQETVKTKNIHIAILTVPVEKAKETTEKLVNAGIRGILNYTTAPINVPGHVMLEEYDMMTSLDKVAYFVKNQN